MNYVVTIARSFGSGGKEIAVKLSKRLCIPVYDREIDALASEQRGQSTPLFGNVDEKLRGSLLKEAFEKWTFPARVEPIEKFFVADTPLFDIQSQILKTLTKSFSCIIVGKAAAYVLRGFPNVASFFFTAQREDCVSLVAQRLGVDQAEAVRLTDKTNKYRADYYRFYSGGKELTDSTGYDLVLNTSRIEQDKCVDAVIAFLKVKFGSSFNERPELPA